MQVGIDSFAAAHDESCRLVYTVVEGQASHYNAAVQVFPEGDGRSQLVWTIDLLPDGTMAGRAGFANEDLDEGRWWLEGDFWCRQWREWSYGQVVRFRIVLEGTQIQWFNAEGRLIDSGLITRQTGPIDKH
jgi:hypothetical protein